MSDDKAPERLRLEAFVAEGKLCPGGCDGEPEFCHVDMLAFAASEVQRDREEAAKAPESLSARADTWGPGTHRELLEFLDELAADGDATIASLRATVARLQEELAAAKTVFAVAFGNYGPDEIDSVWTTKEAAEDRCDELDGDWRVRTIEVQSRDTAQRVERKTP